MTDTIKPPLPETLRKALGRFAMACAFGDDLGRRIHESAALEDEIRDYADAAVAQERERIAAAMEAMHTRTTLHNYYLVLARDLREDLL